eukprot:1146307-Pelagomonas_calceolata.AAC.5
MQARHSGERVTTGGINCPIQLQISSSMLFEKMRAWKLCRTLNRTDILIMHYPARYAADRPGQA